MRIGRGKATETFRRHRRQAEMHSWFPRLVSDDLIFPLDGLARVCPFRKTNQRIHPSDRILFPCIDDSKFLAASKTRTIELLLEDNKTIILFLNMEFDAVRSQAGMCLLHFHLDLLFAHFTATIIGFPFVLNGNSRFTQNHVLHHTDVFTLLNIAGRRQQY